MRTIESSKITETIARLCQQANYFLPEDVWQAAEKAYQKETSEGARGIMGQILENARYGAQKEIALCQDTGLVELFIKIGQDVHISGGSLMEAVNRGVADGYKSGYLRFSMVGDPLERKNTGDNTPAVIYSEIVQGDKIEITILPKGGGSENASQLTMLSPSVGWEGVKKFVVDAVKAKGANACPPLIIGVGIGGSFSSVGALAKKAVLRTVGKHAADALYARREAELLEAINATDIGPMGLGGRTTALAVHIESAPCHIASLPAAVSMQCHSLRRKTEII